MQHVTRDVGEVRLHCVEAGEGEAVVLLHGFPEFWYSWRRQIQHLAAAGFTPSRRIARVQRVGPAGAVCDYRMTKLVEDVANLICDLGGRVRCRTRLGRGDRVEAGSAVAGVGAEAGDPECPAPGGVSRNSAVAPGSGCAVTRPFLPTAVAAGARDRGERLRDAGEDVEDISVHAGGSARRTSLNTRRPSAGPAG